MLPLLPSAENDLPYMSCQSWVVVKQKHSGLVPEGADTGPTC